MRRSLRRASAMGFRATWPVCWSFKKLRFPRPAAARNPPGRAASPPGTGLASPRRPGPPRKAGRYGQPIVRTTTVDLIIQAATGLTGVKGRFVTPEGVGIAGVIVRADVPGDDPQTTTDAAGNFQLVNLPAGTLSLRFDATPANPLYPIWPYELTLPAEPGHGAAGLDDQSAAAASRGSRRSRTRRSRR